MTWEDFCFELCEQFGHEEYQSVFRQFFHLGQSGTVADYIEKFTEMMHALKAHHSSWDPNFFPSHFVEGLRDVVKAVVLVHRPKDLATAISVACLQEEALELGVHKEPRCPETTRSNLRGALPLPPPPPRATMVAEDKHGQEAARSASTDDRVAALCNYRRAKGLCFICGKRWAPGHKCGSTVNLNVVEEMFAMLGCDTNGSLSAPSEAGQDTATLLTISSEALTCKVTQRTVRLQGVISNCQVSMLIDSGSSHSFINDHIAEHIPGVRHHTPRMRVRVADGGFLFSDQELPNCSWHIQGVNFQTDLKILPLGCYDVILGMDLLEEHSPMDVDWKQKTMQFQYLGQLVLITGVRPDISRCSEVTVAQLSCLLQQHAVACTVQLCSVDGSSESGTVPMVVQNLITDFAAVFDEPVGLPPPRLFDHAIPLIPGAQPVNRRPYRYNPAQKDEIEKQVKAMLAQGVIQSSVSLFASPALLVQKKDGSWRMCVDYRHLNALTVKNRYPLPVIDELLDELAGAAMFSSLDMRAGYHQIRMKPEDESTMNTILAPLLRRCVLVFIDDILVYITSLEEHVIHLRQVFELLQAHDLRVKKSKCAFAQKEVTYLGHVVSAAGVATDTKNILAVQK